MISSDALTCGDAEIVLLTCSFSRPSSAVILHRLVASRGLLVSQTAGAGDASHGLGLTRPCNLLSPEAVGVPSLNGEVSLRPRLRRPRGRDQHRETNVVHARSSLAPRLQPDRFFQVRLSQGGIGSMSRALSAPSRTSVSRRSSRARLEPTDYACSPRRRRGWPRPPSTAAGSAGIRISTKVPSPSTLVTVQFPPIACARPRMSASPK